MASFFDMGTKEAIKDAIKKKEREATTKSGPKGLTYGTISPSSKVGKASVQTKGTSR